MTGPGPHPGQELYLETPVIGGCPEQAATQKATARTGGPTITGL